MGNVKDIWRKEEYINENRTSIPSLSNTVNTALTTILFLLHIPWHSQESWTAQGVVGTIKDQFMIFIGFSRDKKNI